MGTKYFKFRQEELPVAGEILLQLLIRDRNKFEGFSTEYNDEFIASVKNQINIVRDVTQSVTLTAIIKKITEDLYQNMDNVLPKLNLIQAYAQKANKTLNIKASGFGVKEAKKMIRIRNVEGYSVKISVINQNIANNLEALKAKDYKETIGTEIQEKSTVIYDLNLKQEQKLSERKQLVVDNNGEFTVLWEMLSDISKMGKLLMKEDSSKAEEYMFSNILKQVRKVTLKTDAKKEIETPVLSEEPVA
jgi:hypothetical protein